MQHDEGTIFTEFFPTVVGRKQNLEEPGETKSEIMADALQIALDKLYEYKKPIGATRRKNLSV